MNNQFQIITRYSLAFLWLFTAITSVFVELPIGLSILTEVGLDHQQALIVIYSASLLDATIGIWLLTNRRQALCCTIQLLAVIAFTLLLSLIAPQYWFHPFGPITKNIPIMVLILLYRNALTE